MLPAARCLRPADDMSSFGGPCTVRHLECIIEPRLAVIVCTPLKPCLHALLLRRALIDSEPAPILMPYFNHNLRPAGMLEALRGNGPCACSAASGQYGGYGDHQAMAPPPSQPAPFVPSRAASGPAVQPGLRANSYTVCFSCTRSNPNCNSLWHCEAVHPVWTAHVRR